MQGVVSVVEWCCDKHVQCYVKSRRVIFQLCKDEFWSFYICIFCAFELLMIFTFWGVSTVIF